MLCYTDLTYSETRSSLLFFKSSFCLLDGCMTSISSLSDIGGVALESFASCSICPYLPPKILIAPQSVWNKMTSLLLNGRIWYNFLNKHAYYWPWYTMGDYSIVFTKSSDAIWSCAILYNLFHCCFAKYLSYKKNKIAFNETRFMAAKNLVLLSAAILIFIRSNMYF